MRPVGGKEVIPDDVGDVLEWGLRNHFGTPVRIVELYSRPLDTFSTHPISRLHLTLDSSEHLTVIFKRLQPRADRDVRREMLIHGRLLTGGRLDAPTMYASVCEEARGRYWMFLEDVGEFMLQWCDTDAWLAAYRWLARMHAAYCGREGELRALSCLGEHGAAFYRSFARTAQEVLQRYAGRRQLARFERLMVPWFDVTVAYLARQPRTLVHGDSNCTNLMVQPGPRIRPIDWEFGAIGVAGWDMAQLLDGWGAEKPRLVALYLDEFAKHATVPVDRRAFERTLAHCEIVRVVWVLDSRYRQGESFENVAFVDKLLDEMESACRYLDS
jgi:aminoglycoside/choline kinase family phosphotransferase